MLHSPWVCSIFFLFSACYSTYILTHSEQTEKLLVVIISSLLPQTRVCIWTLHQISLNELEWKFKHGKRNRLGDPFCGNILYINVPKS